MRKVRKYYTEAEKLSLLREYHESGLSKMEFARLHDIPCSNSILQWMRRYETVEKSLPLPLEETDTDMANRSKADYRDEIASLKKRIKELEKSLEYSKLETKVSNMMIDKAEEYFNIQIRKKSGAK